MNARTVLALIAFLFAACMHAVVCSCAPSQPTCAQPSTDLTIFVGKAVSIAPGAEAILATFITRLTPKDRRLVERLSALDLPERLPFREWKRLWSYVLPEAAREIAEAQTVDQLEEAIKHALHLDPEGKSPAQFEVPETLQGEHRNSREVWTGHGGGDCGYVFEPGKTYLVYAHLNDESQRLETTICSGTDEIERATDKLAYLRAAKSGTVRAGVLGHVTTDYISAKRPGATRGPDPKALADVELTLSHAGSTVPLFVMRSGSIGDFRFANLDPGHYQITATKDGYRFPDTPAQIDLTGPYCTVQGIWALKENP